VTFKATPADSKELGYNNVLQEIDRAQEKERFKAGRPSHLHPEVFQIRTMHDKIEEREVFGG